MKRTLVSAAFLCSMLFAQNAAARDLCLGTFTSFRFHNESGDLQGVEIKIVYTRTGNQAVIQFSEGEPAPLIVVPVICDGAHLSLKIPKDDARPAASFEGVVSKDRLVGNLVYETGAQEKLSLPRHKGYWD